MFSRLLASRKRPYIKNLDNLETVEMDLSGTKLCMQLPPQDFEFEEKPWQQRVNIHQMDTYDSFDIEPSNEPSGIQTARLMHRSWNVYGPITQLKNIGCIDLTIHIAHISFDEIEPSKQPSLSCLNKHTFESIILRQLYFDFGPGGGSSATESNMPINWQIINLGPTEAVALSSVSSESTIKNHPHRAYNFTHCLFTPIEMDKYLIFYFRVLGYPPARLSVPALQDMVDHIKSKISVTLSDTNNEQQTNAYRTKREPENWVYPIYRKGNPLKGESRKILEKNGSPAPELTF